MKKSQNSINQQWEAQFSSNVGTVTILTSPLTTPPGLRKPYHIELSTPDVQSLISDLRGLTRDNARLYQCALVDAKGLTYGTRLNLFVLSYNTGLVGEAGKGASAEEWQEFAGAIKQRLEKTLKEKAVVYIEPHEKSRKFQLRFEIYIKHVK